VQRLLHDRLPAWAGHRHEVPACPRFPRRDVRDACTREPVLRRDAVPSDSDLRSAIHTSGAGTFADSGDTIIEIGQSCAIRCANSFLEFFTSTAPISTPGQATGGGQIMNT